MVHPEDERYAHLIGKHVTLPLCNRTIPIIADDYVDKAFGTGVVKVTPAHDQNDYQVGQRHKLPMICVLTLDAKIDSKAPSAYVGWTGLRPKTDRQRPAGFGADGRDQKTQTDGAALRPYRPGDRANADRSVVCGDVAKCLTKTPPAKASPKKPSTRCSPVR
jgi:hypothetical protein